MVGENNTKLPDLVLDVNGGHPVERRTGLSSDVMLLIAHVESEEYTPAKH